MRSPTASAGSGSSGCCSTSPSGRATVDHPPSNRAGRRRDRGGDGRRRQPGTVTITIDVPGRCAGSSNRVNAARDVDPVDSAVRGCPAGPRRRQLGLPPAHGDRRSAVVAAGRRSLLSHFEVISGRRRPQRRSRSGAAATISWSRPRPPASGATTRSSGQPTAELRLATPTSQRRRRRAAATGSPRSARGPDVRRPSGTAVRRGGGAAGAGPPRSRRCRWRRRWRRRSAPADPAAPPGAARPGRLGRLRRHGAPGLRAAHICGSLIEASYPLGPRLGCPMNITAFGNDDRLDVGIALDPVAIAEPETPRRVPDGGVRRLRRRRRGPTHSRKIGLSGSWLEAARTPPARASGTAGLAARRGDRDRPVRRQRGRPRRRRCPRRRRGRPARRRPGASSTRSTSSRSSTRSTCRRWSTRSTSRPSMGRHPGRPPGRLLARIDLNELLDKLDLDLLLERMDINRCWPASTSTPCWRRRPRRPGRPGRPPGGRRPARPRSDHRQGGPQRRVLQRVDIDALVEQTELGSLIARSGSAVMGQVVDVVRSQGVGLDSFVHRWVGPHPAAHGSAHAGRPAAAAPATGR